MAVLLTGIVMAGLLCAGEVIFGMWQNRKTRKSEYHAQLPAEKVQKFSTKDYLERMDKELLRLAEEAESEEKYVITLVWVWDVLKIYPDGTREWTSRRPERDKAVKSAITPVGIINSIDSGIANTVSVENLVSMNEYSSLASRIAELQCQASQIRVNQHIEECLRDSVASTRPAFTGAVQVAPVMWHSYLESLYHGAKYEG